ncbi:hypothetical protein Vafri_13980 [Volvox africanus]|uniref:Uncharacterized protein n=1 Tax=Volvox africanus TaxID=51714 RepID=A0A8J4F457_9CHLO|nr:hypothetical protein Vafri_13980 [Volvox africanus]
MAQQSQPVVPFNALKPATWGSLKLLPLALRSKLTGTKGSDDANRVGVGKENAVGQSVIPQAPPKLGDLSHLHAIGPRRSVNQRYVLQPNLSVTRPMLATHAPGLSSLLLPGMAPIATQHSKQQQQEQATARQQTPMRQRSSTPSSPSLRGRQPQANPNFAPPASNISTRLPTPVRINASPSPSPTSVAPMLPKPPSPSRSLSQGGAPSANPFACASACSSPSASTTISNTFMLPTPPSILTNIPPPRVTPVQLQQAPPRSTLSPAPWASGPAQSNLTPTSVRPSPSVPERSILASVQLINQQQQRSADADTSAMAISASAAALPGHSEWLPPVAAPAPSIASPVLSAPAIQAALQQALQGAVERKPETFRVDNFESFFDSMMHPGDPGKLDGPLPHELTDDIRYSDAWYKHCRDWNSRNKPIAPYSAPVSAVCQTTSSCQFPFVVEKLVVAQHQQESDGHGLEQQQQWSVGDAPMSDACCKALDIAHHGLSKVFTPTSRSRSASDMTGVSEGGAMMAQQPFTQCSIAVAEGDNKAPSGAQEVVHTAAALTSALETLARDQNPVATTARDCAPRGGDHGGLQRRLAPALNLVASSTATPLSAAAVHEANSGGLDNSAQADTDAAAMITGAAERSTVQVPNTALPLVRRKFAVPVLQLSILDAPMLPRASGAALSPAPDSARPPSTAATTPGPRTPAGGEAESTATTAATTPVGRDAGGAPTTPTTNTARSNAAVSPFIESTSQPVLIDQESHAAAAVVAVPAAMPPRRLSHELAVADSVADRPSQAAQPGVPQKQPSSLAVHHVAPSAQTAELATDSAGAIAGTWSPGFPPPACASPGAVPSTSTAPLGLGTVITIAQQRPPSPVTLLQNAPRDMPTPNPAFFNSTTAAPGTGASSLAAAVTAAAVLAQSRGPAEQSPAGPSMSAPSAPTDPLKAR